MAQQVRLEYMQIPVVTRVYTTACVLTTLAVVSYPACLHAPIKLALHSFSHLLQQLGFVTPLQLLYHPQLILQGEVGASQSGRRTSFKRPCQYNL